MEGGSEGMGSEKEKNLGSNSVRGESNRFGGGSSYKGSTLSMESISMKSDAFNDREVNIIKRMVLEQEKKERKDNIIIKGIKIERRVEKKWVFLR